MSTDIYPVKPHIAERAYLRSMAEYERLYRLSLDNPEWFWGEQAKALSWFHPYQSVLDVDYEEVDFAWYSGGRLNASFNCVDRHLPELGDRTAIIWVEDEPGVYHHISYRELKHNVCRVANVLINHGVKKGDRVCVYMTMIPQLKTRSGKIMRRILRKIASSDYDGLGDVSTLAEPEVVQRLIDEHRSGRAA